MPDGAQAWKMIKPPGSQIGRIAQACDRCRSKKIRCDGKRPSCTQCQAVGFECRTSDKLSRRAFPRGYTESLEDHIRQLEHENRQLKDHLDRKDEQLELLSKVDSLSPTHAARRTVEPEFRFADGPRSDRRDDRSTDRGRGRSGERDSVDAAGDDDDETFVVRELTGLNLDGTYEGASSGRVFAEVFREKLAAGAPALSAVASSLYQTVELSTSLPRYHMDESYSFQTSALPPALPPRVLADQLVTFFFKDWHPVFPILHAPTFLAEYERCYSSSTLLGKEEFLVQLYLVFAIAARQVSATTADTQAAFESRWQRLFATVEHRNSLATLQSLVLAQLDMCVAGRHSDLWQYKMKAAGMALRLGLHQGNSAAECNRLESELRLRLFWAVYVLDTFSSALLGLPPVLQDVHVQCPLPTDVDDECLTEKFVLTSTATFTKVSVSIALIRYAQIVRSIMDTVYLSTDKAKNYKRLFELEDELGEWYSTLPAHLKYELVNGIPRTSLASLHSRAPFLTIVYHYARILIHRPGIATEDSKTRGSFSILAIVDSAKSIVAMSHHLRTLSVAWTICLNEAKTLLMAGVTILYAAMDYPKDGALVQESHRILRRCLDGMHQHSGVSMAEYRSFERLCQALLNMRPSNESPLAAVVSTPDPIATKLEMFTDTKHEMLDNDHLRRRLSESSVSPLSEVDERIQLVEKSAGPRMSAPASMIIPHLPASNAESPAVTGSAVSGLPAALQHLDMDVLSWALSQQQQLHASMPQSAAAKAAHQYLEHIPAHDQMLLKSDNAQPTTQQDSEIELLFAMMGSGADKPKRKLAKRVAPPAARSNASTSTASSGNRTLSAVSDDSASSAPSVLSPPGKPSGDWSVWWDGLLTDHNSGTPSSLASSLTSADKLVATPGVDAGDDTDRATPGRAKEWALWN
ncbi:fungal-specific transcription factor domain-containing protein [Dipodascopsis tothii]|uniref:fungal-specific transcription factor domain-containing protein n=1 Tax=Dipodascopsis tothii TaxID=44089 RepID=UPI0034CD8FE3